MGCPGICFYGKSERYVSPEAAKGIVEELRKTMRTVPFRKFLSAERSVIVAGVFVNENPEAVRSMVKELDLDIVQLSGDESPEYIEELKLERKTILKAVRIREKKDMEKVGYYKFSGVNVLLDAAAGAGELGAVRLRAVQVRLQHHTQPRVVGAQLPGDAQVGAFSVANFCAGLIVGHHWSLLFGLKRKKDENL